MDDTDKDIASSTPVTDAGGSFAAWIPDKEERYDMIEVAAYHIAERSGFKTSPHDCWAAAEEQIKMIEIHALHRDGHEFPVELAVAAVMTEGKPEFSAFIRDITERKRAEAELREMATTDFLTGLANRRHFIARMTDPAWCRPGRSQSLRRTPPPESGDNPADAE